MKILQINNLYQEGSTGKIVYDIHKGLQEKGEISLICYANGRKAVEKGVYKVSNRINQKIQALRRRFFGDMYGGCLFSTRKIIRIIKKEKPDVVHLHCINAYTANIFKLLNFLKKYKQYTILTQHAEFMYTANCGHALDCEKWKTGCGKCPRLRQETKSLFFDRTHSSWMKMKKAFDGFDRLIVTSVSPWLMDRAKQSPILMDKDHRVVLNGLDTEVFHYYDTQDLREKLGLQNKKIVFHATPSFDDNPNNIKGGHYLLKLARNVQDQDIVFLVAGKYPDGLQVPQNVILLGKITDQVELAKYYSMADVTLLVSKKETFSMVTAESLCCGTPIVGFKAGAPEQISIPAYSEWVEQGDLIALEKAIARNWNALDKKEIAEIAQSQYGKKIMSENYLKIYRETINR